MYSILKGQLLFIEMIILIFYLKNEKRFALYLDTKIESIYITSCDFLNQAK